VIAINVERLCERRANHRQNEPRLFARRAERAGELGRERRHVSGFERRAGTTAFDARELQQRIDHLEQPLRIALRRGHQRLLGTTVEARERFFERPEHQRERCPELVTDVSEEGRLGTIYLGERLATPPLGLVGLGFDERAANAGRHQIEERPIFVVHHQMRTDATDQEPERIVARCARDRHREQLRFRTTACERTMRSVRCIPLVRVGNHRQLGRQRACSHIIKADAADLPGQRCLRLTQIHRRERNVQRVPGKRIERTARHLGRLPRPRLALTQLPQQIDPALADDAIRGLRARAKDTVDPRPVRRHDRAEAEANVDLFGRQASGEVHEQIFRPGRFTGLDHAPQHRADSVPDLAPAFAPWRAKESWMLVGAKERNIRVVVEDIEVLAPVHDDGNARREA
jgi:hypothetical protein